MNEKEKEYTLQTIKTFTAMMNILSVAILATMTGLTSLFFNWKEFTGKMFAFGFFGLIALFVQIGLFSYYIQRNKKPY